MAIVMMQGFECERCRYRWVPRNTAKKEPSICPKCKSPYWNKPRQVAIPQERRATYRGNEGSQRNFA